jgi:hypothetical protein
MTTWHPDPEDHNKYIHIILHMSYYSLCFMLHSTDVIFHNTHYSLQNLLLKTRSM